MTATTAAPHDTELALFEELIQKKSGIVLKARRADLSLHLTELLKESPSLSALDLFQVLANEVTGHRQLAKLINALTIGETHFFRNQPQFDALERHILPELIARNRPTRELRIWSAGCASGEEPYSIAILLHKLIPDLAAWKIHLLATDINEDALEKARAGLYGSWSFRQVPQHVVEKHFVPAGRKFKIQPRVAELVNFAPLNLAAPSYPLAFSQASSMDLILCRNVFIYFNEATIRSIAGKFHALLNTTGWLVVGHSEPSQTLFGDFAPCDFPGTVVYRKTPRDTQGTFQRIASSGPMLEAAQSADNSAGQTFLSAEKWSRQTGMSSVQPPPDFAAIEQWIEQKRTDTAEAALARALENDPDDPIANFLMARICAMTMKWESAQSCIERAIAEDALRPEAHFLNGQILAERGQADAALEAYRRCTFLDPNFTLAHYLTALHFAKRGQFPQAHKAMERMAHCLDRGNPEDLVPGGEGLTIGHARELIKSWRSA